MAADNKTPNQLDPVTTLDDTDKFIVGVGSFARRLSYSALKTLLTALYQPLAAGLTSLAALGTAANKMAYTTAEDTWAETAVADFGRARLADADAATARTALDVPATSVTDGLATNIAANTSAINGLGGLADLDTVNTGQIENGAVTVAKLDPSEGIDGQIPTNSNGTSIVWADPASGSAKVAQVVSTVTGAVATGTTTIPNDDSIPQNNEGTEFLTQAITPTNASSLLVIQVTIYISNSSALVQQVALFQDTTADALAAVAESNGGASAGNCFSFTFTMTAGTTSSTTFKVRAGGSVAGTTTLNGFGGVRKHGGVALSSLTITEVLP